MLLHVALGRFRATREGTGIRVGINGIGGLTASDVRIAGSALGGVVITLHDAGRCRC